MAFKPPEPTRAYRFKLDLQADTLDGLFQLPDECDVLFNGTGEDCAAVITLGHFRAARALINEIKETK